VHVYLGTYIKKKNLAVVSMSISTGYGLLVLYHIVPLSHRGICFQLQSKTSTSLSRESDRN